MFELKFANSYNYYYYEEYKLVQVYGQSLINVLSKMVSKKQKRT